VSVNFTVRIPKELVAKMRKYKEINWSEVVRKSIERYIMELEEAKSIETPYEIIERLKEIGVREEDIIEYSETIEERYHRDMVKKEWQRNYIFEISEHLVPLRSLKSTIPYTSIMRD